MNPFVSVDWLRQHRDQVVLVDIRWYLDGRPGRPAYEAGHIPGAVFLELDEVLSAPHDRRLHKAAIRCRHPSASPRVWRHSGSAMTTQSSPMTTPAA